MPNFEGEEEAFGEIVDLVEEFPEGMPPRGLK